MPNLKLMQPQEIEVLYILPAIRREFTAEMKKVGIEQKKIASMLCVTEAAVSQYLNSKRASNVKFGKKDLEMIKKSSRKITDSNSMVKETQYLLKNMRCNGLTCDVHKKLAGDLPEDCLLCDC